jgi:arylsulfate sulfotransferase
VRCNLYLPALALLALSMNNDLQATVAVTALTPSLVSPQPVGTTVTWTATATDTNPGPLTYQFSVGLSGVFVIVRDYAQLSSFDFTPTQREGVYAIRVIARDAAAIETATMTVSFTVTSLVVSGQAAVTATTNPLVALFSAPLCPSGSFISAVFWQPGSGTFTRTDWKPCSAATSNNLLMAGMKINQKYNMNYQVATGTTVTSGTKNLVFQTGTPAVTFPTTLLIVPATSQADSTEKIVLFDVLTSPGFPFATDRNLNPVWYYPRAAANPSESTLINRPLVREGMLLVAAGVGASSPSQRPGQILREIDLAGNTLRETNADRIGEQIVALGGDPITSVHHDSIRLPNGNTAVIGSVEKLFPPGTQGSLSPDPVDILGDMIVVLDKNWQVTWFWSQFDHLDVARAAILGETCHAPTQPGCPPVLLASVANDWTHSNSLFYDPSDGNFIMSSRHQDWVFKIDYSNGAGTKDILWRMGVGGDFTINSSDPYPWFSHQHDAAFENGGTTLMTVYDNGNTRVALFPGSNSRGQAFTVDQVNKTVTPVVNVDLGVYSFALGSAQLLSNGNYMFESGIFPFGGFPTFSQTIEISGGTTQVFNVQAPPSYRSWLMPSLYSPPVI